MLEQSKCFRTGRIVRASKVMLNSQNNMPYVLIELTSRFQIDVGEVIEEATNVLLIGESVEWWKQLSPPPVVGDLIRLSYVTAYVKNGRLCCRVTDPTSIEVEHSTEKASESRNTGANYETISARDFFRRVVEDRKGE